MESGLIIHLNQEQIDHGGFSGDAEIEARGFLLPSGARLLGHPALASSLNSRSGINLRPHGRGSVVARLTKRLLVRPQSQLSDRGARMHLMTEETLLLPG